MIEINKILSEVYDLEARPLFKINKNKKGTRGHKYKLFKSRANFDTRKYFFTMRVVDPWNSLPAELVEVKTTNSFKNGLDKLWENHPLKYTPL